MYLTNIDKARFSRALSRLRTAARKKNPVRIEAGDALHLVLRAGQNTFVTVRTPADVLSRGSGTVAFGALDHAVHALPDAPIRIDTDAGGYATAPRIRLATDDTPAPALDRVPDFQIPSHTCPVGVTLPADTLQDLVRQVLPVLTADTFPQALLICAPDGVTMVGTNIYHLVHTHIRRTLDLASECRAIVPLTALKALGAFLHDDRGRDIQCQMGDGVAITCSGSDWTLAAYPSADSVFPNYTQKLQPDPQDRVIALSTAELRHALDTIGTPLIRIGVQDTMTRVRLESVRSKDQQDRHTICLFMPALLRPADDQ